MAAEKLAQEMWKQIAHPTVSHTPSGKPLKVTHDAYMKYFQLHPELGESVFDVFDVLLIDEAHDLSPCQLSIFEAEHRRKRMRSIIVFDPHQAIYGFRGAADCNQLLTMESDFKTFPLRRTFRFGDSVAALANAVIRSYKPSNIIEITAADRETTIESVQLNLSDNRHAMYLAANTKKGCDNIHQLAILARSNLRLVEEAIYAAGDDLVESLEFVKQREGAHEKYLRDLRSIAEKELNPSSSTWMCKFKSVGKVKQWAKKMGKKDIVGLIKLVEKMGAQEVIDRIDLIYHKAANVRHRTNQYSTTVQTSFEPQVSGTQGLHVVFSTTHGAKGLGWHQVYLAGDYLGADEDVFEPLQQENHHFPEIFEECFYESAEKTISDEEVNCFYVALTRAKRRLWINNKIIELLQERNVGLDIQSFPKSIHNNSKTSLTLNGT